MRLPDAEKMYFMHSDQQIFFWGRTQTPRMDFTTSVLAESGSARHGTVCPPKPKILATPLTCNYITCFSGLSLSCINEIRYLGIFEKTSRYFKCSLDHAKRSFYRSANAIFGKVGRIA